MANYSVTGEQLTSIADAIRAKVQLPPSGKNLCNPTNLTAAVSTNTTYTVSMKVTWNGETQLAAAIEMSHGSGGGQPGVVPVQSSETHEAGEVTREYKTVKTNAAYDQIEVRAMTGITISEVQVEAGDTMTSYEPFQQLISFPDGFVSAIESIGT